LTEDTHVDSQNKITKKVHGGTDSNSIQPPADIWTTTKQSMSYVTVRGIESDTSWPVQEWPKQSAKELMSNAYDFLRDYYPDCTKETRKIDVFIKIDSISDEDSVDEDKKRTVIRIVVRNSNIHNILVFENLEAVFNYTQFHSTKRNQHREVSGALGDYLKRGLGMGYALWTNDFNRESQSGDVVLEGFSELVATRTLTFEDYLSAFPFPEIRPKQHQVIQEICDAFNSGYKVIAPTGFGKSPVAMCVARTLGSSYTCSATKELQTQYVNDFPFLRSVKGMGNFTCLVREDFAQSDNYRCGQCGPAASYDECRHKSVGYGPCRTGQIEHAHIRNGCPRCDDNCIGSKFHSGCRYRTYREDYMVVNQNTLNETIFIDDLRLDEYQKWYRSTGIINTAGDIGYGWMHLNNLKKDRIRDQFQPCPYYDQLNRGLVASHSIFNYANFLIFLRMRNNSTVLPEKELLVLDEGHQIENQIVEHIGLSLTRRTLQKYIPTYLLENATLDYSSAMEEWLKLLENLHRLLENAIPMMTSEEIKIDAKNDLHKLGQVIDQITLEPDNWIVSNIERQGENGQRRRKKQQHISNNYHIDTSNQDTRFLNERVQSNKIIKIEFKPLIYHAIVKGCSRDVLRH
jgi:DEAD_2